MDNHKLVKVLLTKAQDGGNDFATIYNKVAMYLNGHYSISSTVQALLCAACIYDLRDDPKISGRKEKIDGKVNHRRGKAGWTGKESKSATQADREG